jgi:hypothetical protein
MNEPRYSFRRTNRWTVSVPVPDADGRVEDDPYKNRQFTPVRLRIRAITDTRVLYQLIGPNIRKDGTAGLLNCERPATRGELAACYPAALADADLALTELAAAIREDADWTIAQLAKVAAFNE